MALTYSEYMGLINGIPAFVMLGIFIVVCAFLCCSEAGAEFITDRIIGYDVREVVDKGYKENPNTESKTICGSSKRRVLFISIFLGFFAGMSLSISALFIYEGCIISSARVGPNDSCPEYPMDCFVFNGTRGKLISNHAIFHCDPLNKTQFPPNMTNPIAWCYGWIYRFQTAEDVLNKFGVCSGLIGLFTTLLVVIIYIRKSKTILFLSGAMLLVCLLSFSLCIEYNLSASILTYGVLFLGASLGVFGIVLYCMLAKINKTGADNPESMLPQSITRI